MSLKGILELYIKKSPKEIVPVDEIDAVCKACKRKVSNGERRMRESTLVEAIKNKKHYITGYRWIN